MAASLVGRKLGMYQITELLGQGGMATVYKGYRDDIDRYVAVKVLPPHPGLDRQFIDRFKLEARTIARLQHPHILPLYDYGVEDEIIYLVMAYVAGGSLATLLDRGPVPLPEIERLLKQVASALDYAHRQGVIHRDIKPDNILLDKEGNVLLADFGIVKIVSGETSNGSTNPALTQTGGLVGTPTYMAPEQGSGLANITAAADLYSLGVVVYEMLTGEQPYTADTPMQVVIKHITDPVPNPRDVMSDLSPEMESVMKRALAKRPEDRYATATAFSDDFARAIRGEELIAQPPAKRPATPNMTLEIPNTMPTPTPAPTAMLTPPPTGGTQPTMIVQQGPNSFVILGGFAIIAALLIVVVLVVFNRPPASVTTTLLPPIINTDVNDNTPVAAVITQAPSFGNLNFSTKNSTGDTVTLQVQNLNPPAGDETYVAWLKNTVNGNTLKLGELTLNPLGSGVLPPYSDSNDSTLPTLYNAVIVTREKKNAIGDKPVGPVAYSDSQPPEVMDALSAIYVTAPDGIALTALANTPFASSNAPAGTTLAGLLVSALAEADKGQQHAGLAQAATTVGGMHLHNEHTINIYNGTEVDYDGDGRGNNPGFKKGVPIYLDDIEKELNKAANAPGGSDNLHGNIESVRVCVGNTRKWVGEIVDIEKQMLTLNAIDAAVKIAQQSTQFAAYVINGVDANGNGQIDPYEDECGLNQIESYGLLAGTMALHEGPLPS